MFMMSQFRKALEDISLISPIGDGSKHSLNRRADLTLEYVAMWVPAESLNSCQELGARLLEPSVIRQALADSMQDYPSTQAHGTRAKCDEDGVLPTELEYLAMTSALPLTTPELDLYYLPKNAAPTPARGSKLRLVSDRSQEMTSPSKPPDMSA